MSWPAPVGQGGREGWDAPGLPGEPRVTISIIIPTLNESCCLAESLHQLRALSPREILVIDGGSSDATVEQAQSADRVLQGARGRAAQMNLGAEHATGEVLLFLHADCTLQAGGLDAGRRLPSR